MYALYHFNFISEKYTFFYKNVFIKIFCFGPKLHFRVLVIVEYIIHNILYYNQNLLIADFDQKIYIHIKKYVKKKKKSEIKFKWVKCVNRSMIQT